MHILCGIYAKFMQICAFYMQNLCNVYAYLYFYAYHMQDLCYEFYSIFGTYFMHFLYGFYAYIMQFR
jgi:hypothetical protein